MKVIALLPMKNEAWILPTYLSGILPLSDEIIAIDDGSDDNSIEIIEKVGGTVIRNTKKLKSGWAEHSIREHLLSLGREHGGTHFICLDADETFTSPFIKHGRNIMKSMKPGEHLSMKWLTLWKSPYKHRIDGIYKNLVKDFIFCDDGISHYPYAFLGVARTPGKIHGNNTQVLKETKGAVLHFQYAAWKRAQLKQIWYRMSEFIKGGKSARRINHAYAHSLDIASTDIIDMPREYLKCIELPSKEILNAASWHLNDIYKWFEEYDLTYFEPLQIWHMEETKNIFLERLSRLPKTKIYPRWILLAHKLKKLLLKK